MSSRPSYRTEFQSFRYRRVDYRPRGWLSHVITRSTTVLEKYSPSECTLSSSPSADFYGLRDQCDEVYLRLSPLINNLLISAPMRSHARLSSACQQSMSADNMPYRFYPNPSMTPQHFRFTRATHFIGHEKPYSIDGY